MILLTGATGNVGSAVLRRLVRTGERVRCLVRDPRRLGTERVRVQIALGDLSDPSSFRNALRGVDTVVHLAATIRDQPRASIEELNAIATLRLVRAAERAGVGQFVFFSVLGASEHAPARFMRAKALAERAVSQSSLPATIFAPSIIYSPSDPFITLMRRLTLLPAVPIAGPGTARFQPIFAGDAADCVIAALREGNGDTHRVELAGPETLSYDGIVSELLAVLRRRRRLLHVPLPIVRSGLRAVEFLMRSSAFATWEEVQLMQIDMTAPRASAGAESLGIAPLPMSAALASA